jgi:hypothetical protein
VSKVVAVALGILTAIGGFVDIGDIVANTETAPASACRWPGWWSSA